ncbi:MAG: hypothetical protein GY950_13315 [bacterium]|nr:hypothetical protein [bacterium]
MWINNTSKVHADYPKDGIVRNHDILGYGPRKNTKSPHTKYYGNDLICDVVYTIDSNGLRTSPPCNPLNTGRSVLFFGGSFTFGSGVNDEETMPYLTGVKTHGRYRIHNFGFRGYGPHQMLSAIEHKMVENIVEYKPKYAIYQALLGHIGRAAGLGSWDAHGPRYTLREDGTLIYDGHFNKWAVSELRKSRIFKKILVKRMGRGVFDTTYVNLFIEIVKKSRQLLETRYPGCEFHVIFWSNPKHKNNAEILEKLKKNKIRVHLVSDIYKLSGASPKKGPLRLSPHDAHPTPLAYGIIADYVAGKIIRGNY